MAFFTVKQLTKSFEGNEVVKDVTFELQKGHCIALLGPNGAGKTTILKMLTGLLKPTNGLIQYENYSAKTDLRQYIGYLPQYPVFHDWMTGKEFLEYVGKLSHLSNAEAKERTKELLELVGIYDAKDRRIGKYSGGMKQRLGIAQAIIHRPKLLLLDEPVSALDPFGRREVLELIKKLKEDTTILFSTHVLNDAEEVSEDVLILHQGKLKVADSLANLRKTYQQAVILLETTDNVGEYISEWKKWDAVNEIILEGNLAKLMVSNVEQTKKLILQEIVQKDIPLERFELSRTSLEDLFIKVVKG